MKTIRVVAAIICDNMENPSRIFATAKGYGEFKGQWEFPGGRMFAAVCLKILGREDSEGAIKMPLFIKTYSDRFL